jgi:hypothetical protein
VRIADTRHEQKVLRKFVRSRITAHRAAAELWEAALPDIEAVPALGGTASVARCNPAGRDLTLYMQLRTNRRADACVHWRWELNRVVCVRRIQHREINK